MKYYAVTEASNIPIHIEPRQLSPEDIKNMMESMRKGTYFETINPEPILPKYMTIPMSEETYKFISSVANIYSTSFGEKEYEINKVKFQIFTEEEYELRYGKINGN